MNTDRLIGILGLAVGVVALITTFPSRPEVMAPAVIILGLIVWYYRRINLPPFTLIKLEKVISFHDADGRRATLLRTQQAKANHRADVFWCRNISADGKIENFQVDGCLAKAGDGTLFEELGKKAVRKDLRHPLKPNEHFNLSIQYDVIDSFPLPCEGVLHFVDYKTNLLKIEVRFHQQRPCRNPKLFFRFGGEERELGSPKMEQGGKLLWVEIKRPKLGATYELEWDW